MVFSHVWDDVLLAFDFGDDPDPDQDPGIFFNGIFTTAE